jgi:hypothetical protein
MELGARERLAPDPCEAQVPEMHCGLALLAGAVETIDDNRPEHVRNGDVPVCDVRHQPRAVGVRFDAAAVVGAVELHVFKGDIADHSVRDAANREPVAVDFMNPERSRSWESTELRNSDIASCAGSDIAAARARAPRSPRARAAYYRI